LRAAIELLRAGRSVVVLEREDPGFGASRRNAGYLGRGLKKAYPKLRERYGASYARAAYAEVGEAFRSALEFIEKEGIDCHLQRCGRYIAASSEPHYRELAAEMEEMNREFGYEFSLLPRSRQREEFASDIYHGGAVIPALGSLHPGLYHKGLLALVLRLGGTVSGRTEVTEVESRKDGVAVTTSRGSIRAGDAVIATNGYTPPGFAWHARRLIPFTAYMAATEPLPDERFTSLIPAGRTVLDTNFNIDFFRPAPDSNRILFGGATGSGLRDNHAIAARLKEILVNVLPQLADVALDHVWTGKCAGTFDYLPHMGRDDRVWYALGYNFGGLAMGSHLGARVAHRIMDPAAGESVFEQHPFPTMPFYRGKPWFLPLAMKWFDFKDGKKRGPGAPAAGKGKSA
jgi:glycine/D-amino acid oxidase-like deaminating enzyme